MPFLGPSQPQRGLSADSHTPLLLLVCPGPSSISHVRLIAGAPYFIKIVQGDNRVSQVALVRTAEDLRTIIPFLREAFDLAVSEKS